MTCFRHAQVIFQFHSLYFSLTVCVCVCSISKYMCTNMVVCSHEHIYMSPRKILMSVCVYFPLPYCFEVRSFTEHVSHDLGKVVRPSNFHNPPSSGLINGGREIFVHLTFKSVLRSLFFLLSHLVL